MDNTIGEYIYKVLNKNEFYFKKKFGQNFLCDEEVLSNIVTASNVDCDSFVLEIGPGMGFLTYPLLKICKQLVAVEIDKSLISILNEELNKYKNFNIINCDFLKMSDIEILDIFKGLGLTENDKISVVANLPYYITSPIIMKLLEFNFVDNITIMVQKEVADRIVASPNNKDYGVLTIAIALYANSSLCFDVPKDCFLPIPNVDSAVVNIKKKNVSYDQSFIDKFFKIVKASFMHRRKTLVNSLSNGTNFDKNLISEKLSELGINQNVRPENLSIENYVELTKML